MQLSDFTFQLCPPKSHSGTLCRLHAEPTCICCHIQPITINILMTPMTTNTSHASFRLQISTQHLRNQHTTFQKDTLGHWPSQYLRLEPNKADDQALCSRPGPRWRQRTAHNPCPRHFEDQHASRSRLFFVSRLS